jgi:hypothetical protein
MQPWVNTPIGVGLTRLRAGAKSVGIPHAHYLTVLDADFERAASKGESPRATGGAESGALVTQNAAQRASAPECTEAQSFAEVSEDDGVMRSDAELCASASAHGMPPKGLEPLTR